MTTLPVLVNRRSTSESSDWADGGPTARSVRVLGSPAAHVHDSFGRGDRVLLHGLVKPDSWLDGETFEERTKVLLDANDRLGEVGISLRRTAAQIDRVPASARAN